MDRKEWGKLAICLEALILAEDISLESAYEKLSFERRYSEFLDYEGLEALSPLEAWRYMREMLWDKIALERYNLPHKWLPYEAWVKIDMESLSRLLRAITELEEEEKLS